MFERPLRDLAYVPRWAIVRTTRTQNVAEHSFFVAVYTMQICRFIGRLDLAHESMGYALWHDVDECITGDIPGPTKHKIVDPWAEMEFIEKNMNGRFGKSAWYKDVGDEAKAVVKAADMAEEILFLAGELAMGNTHVGAIVENTRVRMIKAFKNLPCDTPIIDSLIKELDLSIENEIENEEIVSGL